MIAAIYREGYTYREEGNRYSEHWGDPESKEFRSEEEFRAWKDERKMDEATDPKKTDDGRYLIEIIYVAEILRRIE
jgi:hypothetical protein